MNKLINVFHNDWESELIIKNNTLSKKNNPNVFSNNYFINNHFLKIIWNDSTLNYFLSVDDLNYYQYTEKYYHIFFKNYSYYFLSDRFTHKLYLANHSINICYDMNNIELYYFFDTYDNKFILYNEIDKTKKIYIHFKNKYFEISYFNDNFKYIKLNDEHYQNEIIINLENNEFYDSINLLGTYKLYGKYLELNCSNKNQLYKLENNIYIKINNENNFEYISNTLNLNDNKNTIIFIYDEIIDNNLIFYLIDNNFNIYIFDHIKNKNNNNIYQNINIIYYKNLIDLDLIKNKIDQCTNIKYYLSNIDNFKFDNKININLTNLDFKYNDILIGLNIKNNETKFKHYNTNLKLEKLKKVSNINNSQIPKILHFIWLGDNQYPQQYYLYLNSWLEKYHDFIFCFWNDDNLFNLYNQKIFDKSNTYAQKSDIARYEILYQYGGIYVDCDVFSIKNIENLLNNIDIFSGYESDKYIAIGLMGFNSKNNYLKKIIVNIELNYYLQSNNNIPNQTGPVYFTNFHNNYIKKHKKYKFFEKNYFYNYSFQDKQENLPIIFYPNNYCYHSWGYSWNKNKYYDKYTYYHILKYIYNNNICPIDDSDYIISDNSNLKNISKYYKKNIFYKTNVHKKNKFNVIHIMGYFFTGGIEKFMLYINQYGDHDKYNYILLFLNKHNDSVHINMDNFTCIGFEDNYELFNLLDILDCDLIIDHYSQYTYYNLYKNNIYQNITIHIIHSAINYTKTIEHLNIYKCIHLYDEENKHESWNSITHNYYNSLGIEINNKNELDQQNTLKNNLIFKNKFIIIGIIGRIVEEKIPLSFFEKLCNLSNIKSNILIHIYGSQNKMFNDEYNKKFNELLKKSKIEFYGQVEYKNIPSIYKKINYLLIPSKYETGSFTCLEALSFGIPVIARNNFGLKKIIKNNINGHLVNNDEEMIEKIKYLYSDNLLENYSIIYNESLKYNIKNKIINIENIFSNNINNKNLIIITSVLNIGKKKLSYYNTRSVFNIHERFDHTKKTIESIRNYIPNSVIIFCECSNLKYYNHMETYLKLNVDYFFNYYDNNKIKDSVNSIYKGLGEASLILECIDFINKNNLIFDNVFKISGRYFLNDDFNFEIYNNNNNQFTLWDNNFQSYASLFYKIKYKYLNLLKTIFENNLNQLKNGETLEILLNKHFNENMNYKNITILNKHNISGYLSTEGYFFTI